MDAIELNSPGRGSVSLLPRRMHGDEALARQVANGDRSAFEAIYARYHQRLYRYCRAIVGNDEDARDALQATIAAALRALPGREPVPLKPWLFHVAHNEAITIVRRRRTESDVDEVELPGSPGADFEVQQRERLRALVADMRQLTERQRSILVMHELSGLSYREIALALDISTGAAKQAAYAGRESLAELNAGREVECEAVRAAISSRDGRRLRGRKLRAHLRVCSGCESFRVSIKSREATLAALAPPLVALVAAELIARSLETAGGASGAGGSAGGGLAAIAAPGSGKLAASSIAAKAAAVGAVALAGAGGVVLSGGALDDGSLASPATGPGSSTAAADAAPAAAGAERRRADRPREPATARGDRTVKPGGSDKRGQAEDAGRDVPATGGSVPDAPPAPPAGLLRGCPRALRRVAISEAG